jgi:hypothetical protein
MTHPADQTAQPQTHPAPPDHNTRHEVRPLLDVPAILAALQDQIDDLRATLTAQQTVIEALQARDD